MKKLRKQDFQNLTSKRQLTECEIPELEGVVYIRTLSVNDAIAFQGLEDNKTEVAFTLVANTVVDEDYQPLFTVEELKNLDLEHAYLIQRIIIKIYEVNGMSNETIEQAKEELKKIPSKE